MNMSLSFKLGSLAAKLMKAGHANLAAEVIDINQRLGDFQATTTRRIDFCKRKIESGGDSVSLLRWKVELETLESMGLDKVEF